MARRAVVVAVAVAALGLVGPLPAVARAAEPVCPNGELETAPGEPLELPTPICTGMVQPVTFLIPDDGKPAHGMITGPPYVYTPNPGFHGLDTFMYKIRNWGGEESKPATVTVIVDNGPSCISILVGVPANVATAIDPPCKDADGDKLDIFVGAPGHGTATVIDGKAVYTPAPGYSGPDSFILSAEDEFYSSGDVTVNVMVSPPPAPVPTVQPAPTPRDTTAPAITLKNASKKQAVAIALTTNENASATLTLTLDKATAKKLKLSRTVGTLKSALTPGTRTLAIKLSAKARNKLKNLKRVKLTLTAVVTDTVGNAVTKTLVVTLKK